MPSRISGTSTGKSLTSGQRWTCAVLVLLGVTVMGMAVSAGHMAPEIRLFAVGFAFLFLHMASNSHAIVEPRLSFQTSAMSPLPRFLLAVAETVMTLATGYFVVSKLFAWLA